MGVTSRPFEIILKDAEQKSNLIGSGKHRWKRDWREGASSEVAMGMGKKRQSKDLNKKWEKRIKV